MYVSPMGFLEGNQIETIQRSNASLIVMKLDVEASMLSWRIFA